MKKTGCIIEALCHFMAVLTAVIAFVALYIVNENAYLVVQTIVIGVYGVVFWYVLSGIGQCLSILENRK